MNQFHVPSDDLIHEQAMLVSRGVRPLAILGQCEAEESKMVGAARHIAQLAVAGVVPFVYDRDDGTADYGYPAAPWVVELFRWTQTDEVPAEQRRRIVTILLGYGPGAIH